MPQNEKREVERCGLSLFLRLNAGFAPHARNVRQMDGTSRRLKRKRKNLKKHRKTARFQRNELFWYAGRDSNPRPTGS